ncbi:MAG TPA: hypothetical protein VGD99_27810, partial [Anaerolineae bacterium]
ELARLPLFTTREQIAAVAASQTAVLEGHIAEGNPLQFHRFVAYKRSVYHGESCDDDGCESIWEPVEWVTPPLRLDLPDGPVHLINDNYGMFYYATSWTSSDQLVVDETTRYEGFEINQPVFIVGRSRGQNDGVAFEADEIYGGNRSDYISTERLTGRIFLIAGVLIGLAGAGVAVWGILA